MRKKIKGGRSFNFDDGPFISEDLPKRLDNEYASLYKKYEDKKRNLNEKFNTENQNQVKQEDRAVKNKKADAAVAKVYDSRIAYVLSSIVSFFKYCISSFWALVKNIVAKNTPLCHLIVFLIILTIIIVIVYNITYKGTDNAANSNNTLFGKMISFDDYNYLDNYNNIYYRFVSYFIPINLINGITVKFYTIYNKVSMFFGFDNIINEKDTERDNITDKDKNENIDSYDGLIHYKGIEIGNTDKIYNLIKPKDIQIEYIDNNKTSFNKLPPDLREYRKTITNTFCISGGQKTLNDKPIDISLNDKKIINIPYKEYQNGVYGLDVNNMYYNINDRKILLDENEKIIKIIPDNKTDTIYDLSEIKLEI